MQEELFAALATGLVTAVACWFGPRLIARVPEPSPDPDPGSTGATSATAEGTAPATDEESAPADDLLVADVTAEPAPATDEESAPVNDPLVADVTAEPAPAVTVKPLYADLAARPRLAVLLAVAGAVTGGVVGMRIGWQPVLVAWVFLSVIGVLLGYIDAQTRLLPTWIIAPSYGVLVPLLVFAGLVDGDGDALIRSALGWLAMGGFYFVMWLIYPKGLGYGDVRLSGLLGLALGYLGWSEVLVGMYAGFLLGGVGGGLLSLVKVFDRKRYPFGPFMLLGALVGLVWGPAFGSWYLNR